MSLRLVVLLLAVLVALPGCAAWERRQLAHAADATAAPSLRKVVSSDELDQLVASGRRLAALEEEYRKRQQCRQPRAQRPSWLRCKHGRPDEDESTVLETIEVTGSRLDPRDVITNNQEGGVDEGDFVKKSGDFLLVLRGGTLHVVRIARAGAPVLEHADSLKLAEDDDDRIWFDEILAFGPRVLLLGFNYGAGEPVAELQLFTLSADGRLRRDARFWLRSNDYFDADNYGARLQGDNLLVSLHLPLRLSGQMQWPEWSRRDVPTPAWTPLVEAEELYYPVLPGKYPRVHVVLQCPLAGLDADRLRCRSTGIVAGGRAELYATTRQAYLALESAAPAAYQDPSQDPAVPRNRTAILRIPFGDAPPAVATVDGSVTQSFQLREEPDGALHVLSFERLPDGDDGQTRFALYRLPASAFSGFAGQPPAPRARVAVPGWPGRVRFGAASVWFGTQVGSWMEDDEAGFAWAMGLSGGALHEIRLPHGADQLQPVGDRMLAIGAQAGGGLGASLLAEGPSPRRLSSIAWPDYVPSEGRSHAVNVGILPAGPTLLGLPAWPVGAGTEDDWPLERAADLVYARIDAAALTAAGELGMQDPGGRTCEDCWDWYGNARTFFIGDRIFALSGSLLAEARWRRERVEPVARLALP